MLKGVLEPLQGDLARLGISLGADLLADIPVDAPDTTLQPQKGEAFDAFAALNALPTHLIHPG